jgi:hypothetical protein
MLCDSSNVLLKKSLCPPCCGLYAQRSDSAPALGGDVVWLLKRAPEEVVMPALLRSLRTAFEQRARTTKVHHAIPATATAGPEMRS